MIHRMLEIGPLHRLAGVLLLVPALNVLLPTDGAAPATAQAAPNAAEPGAAADAAADARDPATIIIRDIAASDPALARQLEEIHAATARYRDVKAALADGYIRDPLDMCVMPEMEGMPPQMGGMGIHYFRPDLLGITDAEPRVAGVGAHTDFSSPGVLVYEPQPDGSLELVAIENLVFKEGWANAGRDGPPAFAGNQFYNMVDNPNTSADEAHGFSPHFELHMWLYRQNPAGLFSQFNPNVSCQHHGTGDNEH